MTITMIIFKQQLSLNISTMNMSMSSIKKKIKHMRLQINHHIHHLVLINPKLINKRVKKNSRVKEKNRKLRLQSTLLLLLFSKIMKPSKLSGRSESRVLSCSSSGKRTGGKSIYCNISRFYALFFYYMRFIGTKQCWLGKWS